MILTAGSLQENYEETSAFFEHVNANRSDVQRLIYDLGEMLLLGKVKGNRKAWKDYVCKVRTRYTD